MLIWLFETISYILHRTLYYFFVADLFPIIGHAIDFIIKFIVLYIITTPIKFSIYACELLIKFLIELTINLILNIILRFIILTITTIIIAIIYYLVSSYRNYNILMRNPYITDGSYVKQNPSTYIYNNTLQTTIRVYKKAKDDRIIQLLLSPKTKIVEVKSGKFKKDSGEIPFNMYKSDKAYVEHINVYPYWLLPKKSVKSIYNSSFKYKQGKVVSVDTFNDDDSTNTTGIYWFLTLEEAEYFLTDEYRRNNW